MADAFRKGLEQPEYVHVLLNPLPVYGMAMGCLALMAALILRSREARILAFLLVFLASVSAWPAFSYGARGYDRVKAMSDSEGRLWLDEHKSRAEQLIVVFYSLAAVALMAIGAEWKRSRAALPLAILTAVLSIGALIAAAYISYPGGHIRHKEFRFEPAPAQSQHR